MTKASEVVIDTLIKNEVDKAWYVQGGAISHVIDAAYLRQRDEGDFKSVFVHHEQAAGFAADAYSRLNTTKLGSVFVTSGPGATNLATSIASNWYDSVPVIYITGQVRNWELSHPAVRQKGFQETDFISMVSEVTKYAAQVTDPNLLIYELEKAIYYATNGRPGPVVVDLPMDVQWAELDTASCIHFSPQNLPYEKINQHLKQNIQLAHDLITQSSQPVILVGGGVKEPEDVGLIKWYSETLNLPVVTSFAGKHNFASEWENNIGLIGTMGHEHANRCMHEADLILVLGSRLSWRQIRSAPDSFAKHAKIIHVDIDPNELGSNVNSTINLNCSVTGFFQVIKKLTVTARTDNGKRLEVYNKLKKEFLYFDNKTDYVLALHPHRVIEDISKYTQSDAIYCLDTGQNLIWSIQGLVSTGKRKFISSWGHSPMGYAICGAIGASELSAQRQVICISGDGGLQMNLQELQTIFLNHYDIKVCVLNNNSLGAIKEFQDDNLGGRHFGTGTNINYSAPDFCEIAKAYDIDAYKFDCANYDVLDLQKILNKPGPALLEFKVEETHKMVLTLEQYQ